jgi:hypothetical protein
MSNTAGAGVRGKRVQVLMSIGGQRYDLQGVTNASAKPRQSMDTFQPAGQELEETDLNHKGWDLEWTCRCGRSTADQISDRQQARRDAGLDREQLTITWTTTYQGEARTYSYSEGDLTIDPASFGGGDDFVEAKFKAMVKYRQRVA